MQYYTKNILTFLSLSLYILFIVWRNESSLYQIKNFYNNSHIPNLIFFIKQNNDSFQKIFPNDFLSRCDIYRNIKNTFEVHKNFNDFSFIQNFTYFFIKEKYLSDIFRDTSSPQLYKDIFDPLKTNSKQTLIDIIQLKPLIQTKMKSNSLVDRNNFDVTLLFQKTILTSNSQSKESIHCQHLKQLSYVIADEFDQQPYNSKKSFLHFILLNLQKKDYNQYLFGFTHHFDTLRILMSGHYPINLYESLKMELITKINILLYLFKNSQNKMEFLMKQIIMETTFLIGLIISYVYFLIWASSILCICIIHMYHLFCNSNNTKTESKSKSESKSESKSKSKSESKSESKSKSKSKSESKSKSKSESKLNTKLNTKMLTN